VQGQCPRACIAFSDSPHDGCHPPPQQAAHTCGWKNDFDDFGHEIANSGHCDRVMTFDKALQPKLDFIAVGALLLALLEAARSALLLAWGDCLLKEGSYNDLQGGFGSIAMSDLGAAGSMSSVLGNTDQPLDL